MDKLLHSHISARLLIAVSLLGLMILGVVSCSRVEKSEIPVRLVEADSGNAPLVERRPVPAWMVGLYRPQNVRPDDGSLTVWVGKDGHVVAESTAKDVSIQEDSGQRDTIFMVLKYRGTLSPEGKLTLNLCSQVQRDIAPGVDTTRQIDVTGAPQIHGKLTTKAGRPVLVITPTLGPPQTLIRER